jgi:hypothetical protein
MGAHADGCCPDGLGPADDPGLRSIDQLVSHFSHTLGGALPPVDLRAVFLVPVRGAMMMLLPVSSITYRRKSVCDEVCESWSVTSVGLGRRAVTNGRCLGGGADGEDETTTNDDIKSLVPILHSLLAHRSFS